MLLDEFDQRFVLEVLPRHFRVLVQALLYQELQMLEKHGSLVIPGHADLNDQRLLVLSVLLRRIEQLLHLLVLLG